MKSLGALLLPNLAFWLLLVSVMFFRFQTRDRRRFRMIELSALLLFILSFPVGPKLLTEAWRTHPFDIVVYPKEAAVIVFGGGIGTDGYGNFWPSVASMRRASVGFSVAEEKEGMSVFLSGGPSHSDGPSEAMLMAAFFGDGAKNIVLDESSMSTWQNALAAKEVLEVEGWTALFAVTDQLHARRALACLRRAGVPIIGLRTPAGQFTVDWTDFIPSVNGLIAWHGVGYEVTASLYYIVTGRIQPSDLFVDNL